MTKKQTEVKVNLNDTEIADLKNLKEIHGLKDSEEVILLSLNLLQWATKEIADGKKVGCVTEPNNFYELKINSKLQGRFTKVK